MGSCCPCVILFWYKQCSSEEPWGSPQPGQAHLLFCILFWVMSVGGLASCCPDVGDMEQPHKQERGLPTTGLGWGLAFCFSLLLAYWNRSLARNDPHRQKVQTCVIRSSCLSPSLPKGQRTWSQHRECPGSLCSPHYPLEKCMTGTSSCDAASASNHCTFSSSFLLLQGQPQCHPGWPSDFFQCYPPSNCWFSSEHCLFLEDCSFIFVILYESRAQKPSSIYFCTLGA